MGFKNISGMAAKGDESTDFRTRWHKVNPVSSEMEDMDAITLNYWLTKFVMEVAKDSGERYPPRTVYWIVCGLKRHLEDKNGVEALNPLDAHDKSYGKLSTLFSLVWYY